MGKSHQDKVFKHRKEVVKYLYDYTCHACNLVTGDLEVHHNNRNPADNSYDNLFPVCHDCHKLIHKTNFYFQRQNPPGLLNK